MLLFLTGCGQKGIEGVVHDPFGKGIEGVSMQIPKTTFTASTDKNGKYSLNYIPGAFSVKYMKPGYTTRVMDLTIQTKSRFPVETIIMYPIPKDQGIYYIGEKELIQIFPARIKTWPAQRSWNDYHYKYYADVNGSQPPIFKPGEARFIDMNPKDQRLAILKDTLIQDYIGDWGILKYIYNGLRDDKKLERIGEEQLLVRTIELEPGSYAWVEVVVMMDGNFRPDGKLFCYPFSVENVK